MRFTKAFAVAALATAVLAPCAQAARAPRIDVLSITDNPGGHAMVSPDTLGTDLIAELEGICLDLIKEFRRPVVFAGQLVFQRENLFTRSLHHETAFAVQRRLQFRGVQVIIMPIRVWDTRRAA